MILLRRVAGARQAVDCRDQSNDKSSRHRPCPLDCDQPIYFSLGCGKVHSSSLWLNENTSTGSPTASSLSGWERVCKLRRSMTPRPALRSGNIPALAILRLLLEDSNG